MKITKKDYRERAARVAAGEGSDDDRRLVELYADEMADDVDTVTGVEQGSVKLTVFEKSSPSTDEIDAGKPRRTSSGGRAR